MAVEDLGYDVDPVDHNPFGAMADSPNNYDVAAVDHDPFQADSDHGTGPADVTSPAEMFAKAPETPETFAHYAGNPAHAMPLRIGAAIGEEVRRMGSGLWSAATLPGDVATGKTTMADPEAQQREMGLAAATTLTPLGDVPEGALTAGSRRLNQSGFYSHGADMAAQLKQAKGTVGQFTAALTKLGVKPEELAKSGLGDLAANMPITRDALVDQFEKNRPPIQETTLGGKASEFSGWESTGNIAGPPSFADYQLPGGQNYREVLLHTPIEPPDVAAMREKHQMYSDIADRRVLTPEEQADYNQNLVALQRHPNPYLRERRDRGATFQSSHWDTPNVVAHLRMSDRTAPMTPWVSDEDALAEAQRFSKFIGEDWSKVPPADQARYVEAGRQELARRQKEVPTSLLHLEELQSDWGQQGREHGFQDPDVLNAYQSYVDDLRSRVKAGMLQDALDDGMDPERAATWAENIASKTPPHNLAVWAGETHQHNDAYQELLDERDKIPVGPFVGSTPAWTDLGLKRALTEAARGGHSGMIWTPGADQADRYPGLSEAQAQGLRGYYDQIVRDADGYPMLNKDGSPKVGVLPTRLAALAKKLDPAAKIGQIGLPDPKAEAGGHRVFRHIDGGFGVQDAEFNELPNAFQTRGEAQAEADRRNANPPQKAFPYLPITPLMRERILKGMPQYRRGGAVRRSFQFGGEAGTGAFTPNVGFVPANAWAGTPGVAGVDMMAAQGLNFAPTVTTTPYVQGTGSGNVGLRPQGTQNFVPPVFSNTMDQENWQKIADATAANTTGSGSLPQGSYRTAGLGISGWAGPSGGGGDGGRGYGSADSSAFDRYSALGQQRTANMGYPAFGLTGSGRIPTQPGDTVGQSTIGAGEPLVGPNDFGYPAYGMSPYSKMFTDQGQGGLDPRTQSALGNLQSRVRAAGYSMGDPISTYRTYEDQRQIYQDAQDFMAHRPLTYADRGPVTGRAAAPGTSPHEFGAAFDTGLSGPALSYAEQVAPSLGLQSVAHDPGHFQLQGYNVSRPGTATQPGVASAGGIPLQPSTARNAWPGLPSGSGYGYAAIDAGSRSGISPAVASFGRGYASGGSVLPPPRPPDALPPTVAYRLKNFPEYKEGEMVPAGVRDRTAAAERDPMLTHPPRIPQKFGYEEGEPQGGAAAGTQDPGWPRAADGPRDWSFQEGGAIRVMRALRDQGGYRSGGPVQLNEELRRRLALLNQPRHGLAEGGDPDLQPDAETVPDDHGAGPIDVTSPAEMFAKAPEASETFAHYAGNPAHAMPLRIGAAIGEEARRMGQGLWSAATAPGDVASGKASMADPETQQRVTSLAASLPGGGPEAALGARGPVGAASRAVRGERELNRWNPTTGQWEGPKPTLNPPEGVTYPPLFNFDPALMNKVPDVPQFELQRYDPPRGVSERMRDLVTNPDVRQQMLQIVRNGMQTVGMSWYNTGQLRAMFLKELGDDAGQQAFEKYMNLVSATSPENKIPQNIRTASYFYERDAQGMPPPERGDPIAQPYGSKAQKLHQQNVQNVLTEGYDVLKNPKPPSFVQNLMGNYAPGTMDRHAFKLPAMLSRDPRFLETSFTPEKGVEPVRPQTMFRNGELTIDDAVNQPTMWAGMPNKNEYAALEGWYKSIADELGITPAQVQASAWVGGGHITGLASAADETFLHSFQGRVFNTAHHTGQTPSEVVRRMIRGEQPLLAGGPGTPPLLPRGQAPTEAQTSTAGAGGSPPPPSDQAEPGHPFY